MKGFENSTYLILYILSNLVASLLLLAAWKRSRLARLSFFLLFAWASWTNWTTAHRNPEFYLEYGELALLPAYRHFIQGWFSHHAREMVSLIAIGQAAIAVSFLLKGWLLKAGILGAIIFLLGIAPLGVGSAFPFSFITAAALIILLRVKHADYLWVRKLYKEKSMSSAGQIQSNTSNRYQLNQE